MSAEAVLTKWSVRGWPDPHSCLRKAEGWSLGFPAKPSTKEGPFQFPAWELLSSVVRKESHDAYTASRAGKLSCGLKAGSFSHLLPKQPSNHFYFLKYSESLKMICGKHHFFLFSFCCQVTSHGNILIISVSSKGGLYCDGFLLVLTIVGASR